jgi:hypothetical protein
MNKIDLKNIIKKFLNQFLQKHTNVEIEGVLVFGSVLREKYFLSVRMLMFILLSKIMIGDIVVLKLWMV